MHYFDSTLNDRKYGTWVTVMQLILYPDIKVLFEWDSLL